MKQKFGQFAKRDAVESFKGAQAWIDYVGKYEKTGSYIFVADKRLVIIYTQK